MKVEWEESTTYLNWTNAPGVLVPCRPINFFSSHKFTACLSNTWPRDTSVSSKYFVFPSTLNGNSSGTNIEAIVPSLHPPIFISCPHPFFFPWLLQLRLHSIFKVYPVLWYGFLNSFDIILNKLVLVFDSFFPMLCSRHLMSFFLKKLELSNFHCKPDTTCFGNTVFNRVAKWVELLGPEGFPFFKIFFIRYP